MDRVAARGLLEHDDAKSLLRGVAVRRRLQLADQRLEIRSAVDIHIAAHGDRGALEALYLELREMAKRKGLKVELELQRTEPSADGIER